MTSNLSFLFNLVTYGSLPFWLLLLFAPRWKYTNAIVHSALVPAALSAAYAAMLAVVTMPEGVKMGTLEGFIRFCAMPMGALIVWMHCLVFDLFIGAWEVRDAGRRKIPHLAVAPCLVLTNMFGPIGLLCYLALRAALRRTATLAEQPEVAAVVT